MLDPGARCEYYGVKEFQRTLSYTGVPLESRVIAEYGRPVHSAETTHLGDGIMLTHPYLFPDWTTALHLIAHWFCLDEHRLLETVISRRLGAIRRPAHLFPWFAEEFPGADPAEGLQLLPESIIEAVRREPHLSFPGGCRSLDGRALDGKPVSSEERGQVARLLESMREAWRRGERLIALDEESSERLISFRDVDFLEGRTVKPTESERLYMHNYGRAVFLSETMRENLGLTAATWLIWTDAPNPFSDESLADCAPDKALEQVNDDLVLRLAEGMLAPALRSELRAELVEWLEALVTGWKNGYWVTYSV